MYAMPEHVRHARSTLRLKTSSLSCAGRQSALAWELHGLRPRRSYGQPRQGFDTRTSWRMLLLNVRRDGTSRRLVTVTPISNCHGVRLALYARCSAENSLREENALTINTHVTTSNLEYERMNRSYEHYGKQVSEVTALATHCAIVSGIQHTTQENYSSIGLNELVDIPSG
jgi:hypothetical protein